MYWGVEQERALDREKPQAHAHPVAMKVDLNLHSTPWGAEGLGKGIRTLQEKGDRCDLELEVGGEAFPAHQIMLASVSKAFRMFLQSLRVGGNSVEIAEDTMAGLLSVSQPAASPSIADNPAAAPPTAPPPEAPSAAAPPAADAPAAPPAAAPPAAENASGANADGEDSGGKPQRLKLQLSGISRPEAVQILLSYVYQVGTGAPWAFKPSCVEVDKDVLQLARRFELWSLHEHAARWLIAGLSTLNVVERLVVCEEFQLGNLREKMMEQLAACPDALGIVSSNLEIMKHPKIMQDLLKSVAFGRKVPEEKKLPDKKEEEAAPPKPEKVDKPEKADKADKSEKAERTEKAEKAEKPEKADKPEKAEKAEKADKAEKGEKAEKAPEKQERPSAEKPPPAKKARKAGGA